MQKYLTDLSPEDAKLVFAYRVRMANYSENFRGQTGPKLCPVCHTHLDNQKLVFSCPELLPSLISAGKYENLFNHTVCKETVINIKTITRLREEIMER